MVRTRIVRQLRNGQITIPKEFRDALRMQPDDMLRVSLEEGALRIEPAEARSRTGSPWLKELYDAFAPVRKSLEGYSEEEINDAIDDAVKSVRARNRRRRSA